MWLKKWCPSWNRLFIGGFFFIFVALCVTPPVSAQSTIVTQEEKNYSLFSEIAGGLMCLCGCGASIKDCPHKNCGFANPLKTSIKQAIEQGQPKEQIIAFAVDKYGEKILTAPTKQGFNIVGYILPGVVIIIAGVLIFLVINRWASKEEAHSTVLEENTDDKNSEDATYKERLEKELKKFDE